MNKIAKLFKALAQIVRKPSLLNLIIESEEVYRTQVIKQYGLSAGLPQIDITSLFPAFHESVSPYAFLDGGSLPTDLALLKSLVKKYNVKDYLEIGTWRGESVANVAEVAENCYTLNLPDDVLASMGKTHDYIASHRYFSKNLSKVKHLFGHSHNFDFESLNTKFDMVFIDGDHHYEAVKKDTQKAFQIIKSEKSVIVWHDYARTPETIRWDILGGILDGCPPEKRQNLFHISNTLCAVYLHDGSSSGFLEPNKLPNKHFKIEIEAIVN